MTSTAERLIEDVTRLVLDPLTRGASAGFEAMSQLREKRSGCGCEIPPPCWYPRDAGAVRSHVCCGGRATLRIRVINRAATEAKVIVEAADPSRVTVEGGELPLGPMQSATAVAKLEVDGDEDQLVWVRGCYEHYIRWTVRETRWGCDACHEIEIEDGPDYVHHWYDHFYCERPCPGGSGRQ